MGFVGRRGRNACAGLPLLLDLLTIERDSERWKQVAMPVVGHIEDLLLVGDFDGALQLTRPSRRKRLDGQPKPRQRALRASRQWHDDDARRLPLRSVDDTAIEQMQEAVLHRRSVGHQRARRGARPREARVARQRLTHLLLGFGAAGRTAVEQLRASANPAVRRTAIHLLREFGGSEALPDLTTLLDDAEPHVQREAVRAILRLEPMRRTPSCSARWRPEPTRRGKR